jgi:hypothetical protein
MPRLAMRLPALSRSVVVLIEVSSAVADQVHETSYKFK